MTLRTFNPAAAPADAVIELGPCRLEEVMVADLRVASPAPPATYVLLFDQPDQPPDGTEPIAAALRTCPSSTVGLDWSGGAPELLAHGWVILSSSPLVLQTITGTQDYAMTARVSP